MLNKAFNFIFPNFCIYKQFVICKRKLESKKEALLILSKELDGCQQERDQYKLMANQLRERHQGLKKKYRELIVRHLCELSVYTPDDTCLYYSVIVICFSSSNPQ